MRVGALNQTSLPRSQLMVGCLARPEVGGSPVEMQASAPDKSSGKPEKQAVSIPDV